MGAAAALPALATTTAATTTGALTAGLTTGAAMGSGGVGLLNMLGAGAGPLSGMASILPAGVAAPGVAGALGGAAAPSLASIFSTPAAALGGLKAGTTIPALASTAPGITSAATPGLLNTMGMNPMFGAKQLAAASNLANPATLTNLNAGFVPNSAISTAAKAAAPSPTDIVAKAPEVWRSSITGQGLPAYSPSASLPPPGYNPQELVAQAAQTAAAQSPIQPGQNFLQNLGNLIQNPSMDAAGDYVKEHPAASLGLGYAAYKALKPDEKKPPEQSPGLIRPYQFTRTQRPEAYAVSPSIDTSERTYFADTFTPLEPYEAPGPEYKKAAEGGIASAYAVGGPVEQMSAMNAVGGNMMYPQADLQTAVYSNPIVQRPEAVNVISPSGEPAVGAYSGEQRFASGGLSDLGGYSDGGRLLKGPGDGVSDSIPAVIGKRQPARLADGEFVIPARIVSELGNGSTEAGARKLYAMMERVQKARKKSIGKKKVAVNSKADKHLPA